MSRVPTRPSESYTCGVGGEASLGLTPALPRTSDPSLRVFAAQYTRVVIRMINHCLLSPQRPRKLRWLIFIFNYLCPLPLCGVCLLCGCRWFIL